MARSPKTDTSDRPLETPDVSATIVPDVPKRGGSYLVDANGKVTRTEWTRLPGEEPAPTTETEPQ